MSKTYVDFGAVLHRGCAHDITWTGEEAAMERRKKGKKPRTVTVTLELHTHYDVTTLGRSEWWRDVLHVGGVRHDVAVLSSEASESWKERAARPDSHRDSRSRKR